MFIAGRKALISESKNMTKTIKRFDFSIRGGRNIDSGKASTTPIVNISLQRWSSAPNEGPVISPDLMSEAEITKYIACLQEDLEAVGQAARKSFREKHV